MGRYVLENMVRLLDSETLKLNQIEKPLMDAIQCHSKAIKNIKRTFEVLTKTFYSSSPKPVDDNKLVDALITDLQNGIHHHLSLQQGLTNTTLIFNQQWKSQVRRR